MVFEKQFWIRDKVPTGLPPFSSRRSEYRPCPRFADEHIKAIQEKRASGATIRELASEYCCSKSAISTALKKEPAR
jgi:hypothetical protein